MSIWPETWFVKKPTISFWRLIPFALTKTSGRVISMLACVNLRFCSVSKAGFCWKMRSGWTWVEISGQSPTVSTPVLKLYNMYLNYWHTCITSNFNGWQTCITFKLNYWILKSPYGINIQIRLKCKLMCTVFLSFIYDRSSTYVWYLCIF
jgi:hypothetical protein